MKSPNEDFKDTKRDTLCVHCERAALSEDARPLDEETAIEGKPEEFECADCQASYPVAQMKEHPTLPERKQCEVCAAAEQEAQGEEQGQAFGQQVQPVNTGIHSNNAQWEILRGQAKKRNTALGDLDELDAYICRHIPGKPAGIARLTNEDAKNLISEWAREEG